MRPWSTNNRDSASSSGRHVCGSKLIYVFNAVRYGMGFSCLAYPSHSCAEIASHVAWLQGKTMRSSKDDIQSDCENRTACWVSQRKQKKANLPKFSFECSSPILLDSPLPMLGVNIFVPCRFQVRLNVWYARSGDRLTVTSPNQAAVRSAVHTERRFLTLVDLLDQQPMEEMCHIMLLLPSS